jgi:hypothetical protein
MGARDVICKIVAVGWLHKALGVELSSLSSATILLSLPVPVQNPCIAAVLSTVVPYIFDERRRIGVRRSLCLPSMVFAEPIQALRPSQSSLGPSDCQAIQKSGQRFYSFFNHFFGLAYPSRFQFA